MAKRQEPDPEARNPFDFLFDELRKLLTMVQQKELIADEQLKLPDDIEKRLEELRKKINQFVRLSDEIVRLSGVSDEEIKMRLSGLSDEVPADGKRLIQRSKEIHEEAQKVSEKLETELRYVSLDEKKLAAAPEGPTDKKPSRELKRSSKFKRFGSDKNWKPL